MQSESGSMRVTVMGLFLNLFLAALKLSIGLVFASAALIADAVHSISDLVTDVVAIIGIRLSSRPADESHPYGHGKLETMAASLIGIALLVVGGLILWNAGLSLYRQEQNIPGYPMLIAAAVSIVAKEWIYQVTRRVARRIGSALLSANAWHHRSDALSSVAVLLGAIGGLLGWGQGDQVAALAVGTIIVVVGLNTLWGLIVELAEGSVSGAEREAIAEAIEGVPGVIAWHDLRTRLVGREVFMDVSLHVSSRLTIVEAHAICSAVEEAIEKSLPRPVNVVVHCEPEGEDGDHDAEDASSGRTGA
ncbi:MAG: cation diffusion facilitator family transporter [Chloroflexota bacterium]|nr:cation diffusion facilitator family transporter [Chloroflexota bacterium]